MNNKNIFYDLVIYGAGLQGVVLHKIYSRSGMKVLLLNRFGFPGGSISESFNLVQKLIPLQSESITEGIINRILDIKFGAKHSEDDFLIFNPEAVKIVLQNELSRSGPDHLFHVTPRTVISDDENNSIHLILLAKEGEITLHSKRLIDASDDFAVIRLLYPCRLTLDSVRLNFIISCEKSAELSLRTGFGFFHPLTKNRYFAGINFTVEDELDAELKSQEFIDEISGRLRASGCRIQTLPPKSHLIYKYCPENLKDTDIVFHANDILSVNPRPSDIISTAHLLETKLDKTNKDNR